MPDAPQQWSSIVAATAISPVAAREARATVATDLFDLGAAARAAGDFGRAARLFREALAIRERLDGPDSFAASLVLEGLATVRLDQQDFTGARTALDRALAIRVRLFGDRHPQVARLHALLGVLEQERGDPRRAELHYVVAAGIYRAIYGNLHDRVASALLNNGTVVEDESDWRMAWVYYRQALDILQALHGENHPLVAATLGNHARLRWKERRYDEAIDLYRRALAMQRQFTGDSHPETVRLLEGLAQAQASRGDDVAAVVTLRAAARAYELSWWRAGSGASRATFLASPYPQLAAALARLGRGDEAWEAADRHAARLLALARRTRNLTAAAAAQRDSIRTAMTRLEAEIAETSEPDARYDARRRLGAVEEQWSDFERTIGGEADAPVTAVATLARLRRALPPGAALLGWIDTELRPRGWETWGWVVREHGPVVWRKLADGTTAGAPFGRALAYRNALAESPARSLGAPAPASDPTPLWRERLAPLLPALAGVTQLLIVPSGALVGTPVETLGDGSGTTLGDLFTVSYVPSAAELLGSTRPARPATASPRPTLVLADPPFSASMLAAMTRETGPPHLAPDPAQGAQPPPLAMAGPTTRALLLRTALDGDRAALAALPRLAATRREASRVSALLGGARLLVGPAASEDTLAALSRRDGLARFAVLHFATHALVDSDDPDRSALVLAQTGQTESTGDGGAHDGLLTVREIERGWRLDADLVTLSACETGLGRRVDGEGYLGLAHALLSAGAHSVLASLWKVDDAATALLMQRFYENWTGAHPDPRAGFAPAAPLPKARALREAKAWLRDWRDSSGQAPYAHPAYGAGFVLVGSPN